MANNQTYIHNTVSIKNPELLRISDGGSIKYFGGDQLWYPIRKKKYSGCGPTNCSNLFWYLAMTRKDCRQYIFHDVATKNNFIHLMNEVWNYVTPRRRGVDTLDIFTEGAEGYADARGIPINCRKLEIPISKKKRPSNTEMFDFLEKSLNDDLPIAFLNLSSGLAKNLDRWHWVTIVSINKMLGTVTIYDQGKKHDINLTIWRNTTVLGGGFVAIEPM